MQVVKINRDENLWKTVMLPKLKQFYMECLLPEIVDGRIPRGMKVREPAFITEAIQKHSEKVSAKTKVRVPKRKCKYTHRRTEN